MKTPQVLLPSQASGGGRTHSKVPKSFILYIFLQDFSGRSPGFKNNGAASDILLRKPRMEDLGGGGRQV